MAQSNATTVQAYLDELPEDRRAVVAAVREAILANLPKGYQESMNWGMISYEIPLERYPDTYNSQPLGYLALVATAGSVGTGILQFLAQMDQFDDGSPERVGVMVGGALAFLLRVALMGLYLAALTKFSAWLKEQPQY